MLREIRRLHAEGLTDSEIARRLELHQSTVQRQRSGMGLESNYSHPTGPRLFGEREARRLHAGGLTDAEIADRLDVARSTITTWRNAQGLPRNGRPGRRKETGTSKRE